MTEQRDAARTAMPADAGAQGNPAAGTGAQAAPLSGAEALRRNFPPEQYVYGRPEQWLVLVALLFGVAFRTLCLTKPLWAYSAFWAAYAAVFVAWNWPRARRNVTAWLVLGAAAAMMALLPYQAALDYMGWMIFLGIVSIPGLLLLHAVLVLYDIPAKREGMAALGLLYACFVLPFASIGRFFGAAHAALSGCRGRRGALRPTLIGLAVGLPLLALVLVLLGRADARMGRLLSGLADGWDMGETFLTLAIVLCVALPFYSFFYGARHRLPQLRPLPEARWSDVTLGVAILLPLVAYAVFLGLQFSYLFGGVLPQAYTYSEYANAGFRELIAVSLLNFTLLALSVRYGARGGLLRLIEWLLLLSTVLLLASAALRVLLYVGAYGLTMRRILSLWLMAYLAALSALTAVRLVRERLPLVRIMGVALAFWFAALYAPDWYALIGGYNAALH